MKKRLPAPEQEHHGPHVRAAPIQMRGDASFFAHHKNVKLALDKSAKI